MANWKVKAIVQKVISLLPGSHRINFLFQKYITKGVHLSDEYFYDRLGHAFDHLRFWKKHKGEKMPECSLELGTGWYPVVPVAMYLSGVKQIFTTDLTCLTDVEKVKTTASKFLESHQKGLLKKFIELSSAQQNTLRLVTEFNGNSLSDILALMNIKYFNGDAAQLKFENEFFDFIHSNNTLEHIYPKFLVPILKEFRRVLSKSGIMSHFIDMSDHFAHADSSIGIYNYLQFTEKKWEIIDNDVQPQNRLRINQYRNYFTEQNWKIIEEELRPGDENQLSNVVLAEPFSKFSKADILPSHGFVIVN